MPAFRLLPAARLASLPLAWIWRRLMANPSVGVMAASLHRPRLITEARCGAAATQEAERMSTLGSNPGQMRALAHQIDIEREQLTAAFRGMSGKLLSTAWQGPDADGFRERWRAHHEARLNAAVRELSHASDVLRSEAAAQERISGV